MICLFFIELFAKSRGVGGRYQSQNETVFFDSWRERREAEDAKMTGMEWLVVGVWW